MRSCPTFLCVDDEPSVLAMQKALLESAGFRVFAASSGREALTVFELEKIDVVLLDYWMPGLNGIQVAQRMKTMRPYVPIVFLSAFTELPGETSGLAHGWIRKGDFPPDALLARLRSLAEASVDPGTTLSA